MKKYRIISILIILLMLGASTASAQSAVYFCKQTGVAGWSFDQANVKDAETKAFNDCKDKGGQNPVLIESIDYGGYGAVVTGKAGGKDIIGVALGYATEEAATRKAKKDAQRKGAKDIKVLKQWNDQ